MCSNDQTQCPGNGRIPACCLDNWSGLIAGLRCVRCPCWGSPFHLMARPAIRTGPRSQPHLDLKVLRYHVEFQQSNTRRTALAKWELGRAREIQTAYRAGALRKSCLFAAWASVAASALVALFSKTPSNRNGPGADQPPCMQVLSAQLAHGVMHSSGWANMKLWSPHGLRLTVLHPGRSPT